MRVEGYVAGREFHARIATTSADGGLLQPPPALVFI
jgi:hypothetical protein